MQITISLQDGLPIYRQIVAQIKYKIASGGLKEGDELPAIRALAQQLLVTPNTVVKAYGMLESEGAIVKRHGSGTFVSDNQSRLAKRERTKILTARADALLAEARLLGFTFEEVQSLLQKLDGDFQASPPSDTSQLGNKKSKGSSDAKRRRS